MDQQTIVLFTLTYADDFFDQKPSLHRSSVCELIDKLDLDITQTTVNSLYVQVSSLRPAVQAGFSLKYC